MTVKVDPAAIRCLSEEFSVALWLIPRVSRYCACK